MPPSEKPYVVTSPALEAFFNLTKEHFSSTRKALNNKIFTIKDSETTYRTMNHWMAEGLITDTRKDNPNGWRRLSYLDLLWLEILSQLREFGFSLEKLRNVHKSLSIEHGKPTYSLEKTFAAHTTRINICLVVLADGAAGIATEECIAYTNQRFSYPSYVCIAINPLWRELLGETIERAITKQPMVNDRFLTAEETEVIATLRTAESGDVQIRLKRGEIDRIDIKNKADPKQRVVDLLQSIPFGEIRMKVEAGRIVDTEVTRKKKP